MIIEPGVIAHDVLPPDVETYTAVRRMRLSPGDFLVHGSLPGVRVASHCAARQVRLSTTLKSAGSVWSNASRQRPRGEVEKNVKLDDARRNLRLRSEPRREGNQRQSGEGFIDGGQQFRPEANCTGGCRAHGPRY